MVFMHLSVIVPVKEFDCTIHECLNALKNSNFKNLEVLLVLDGWTDKGFFETDPSDQAIKVFHHPKAGPAVCRNFGAAIASGKYLAFVDSDVVISPDTFQFAINRLENSEEHGLIGSYDAIPKEQNYVSKFRNLLHHFHHQKNNGQTGVFWGAFSIIEKSAFLEVGGFDESFKTPSIEDVELGLRLSNNGFVVRVHADIQVKHLKKWTLFNWMRTDIFLRAKPWTLLILTAGMDASKQLNTNKQEKISALFVLMNFTILLASLQFPFLGCFIPFSIIGFFWTQRDFYNFLSSHFKFLPFTFILHHLYFLFAFIGLALGNLTYLIRKIFSISSNKNNSIIYSSQQ